MGRHSVDLVSLVLNRGWSRSQSWSARRHELNFEWCLLEGAPSLSSSSDAPVSSCRLLWPFLLIAFPFISFPLDLLDSFIKGLISLGHYVDSSVTLEVRL
jgi:hypothetical protein